MRRRRRGGLSLLVLALAALAALGALVLPERGEAEISGPATVVDGDTLTVAGNRIRLHGVDAPEASQVCTRDGLPWRCGADATEALRKFLRGRQVACTPIDRDRFGRIVARCRAGGEDLGAWLVREGLAVAYTDFSWRYVPEELRARWAGRGLWAGSFQTPADYRRGTR
jgi:endonuclease YncB( thermonuclease family)